MNGVLGGAKSAFGEIVFGSTEDGVVVQQDLSQSGTGSQSIVEREVIPRTISQSGSGSQTIVFNHVLNVSHSGTGTQTLVGLGIISRSVSQSGTGSQTIVGTHETPVIQSGTGSQTITEQNWSYKSVSSSGVGIQHISRVFTLTVSQSGTGTDHAFANQHSTTIDFPQFGTGTQTVRKNLNLTLHVTQSGTGTQSFGRPVENISHSGTGSQTIVPSKVVSKSIVSNGLGSQSSVVRSPVSILVYQNATTEQIYSGSNHVIRKTIFHSDPYSIQHITFRVVRDSYTLSQSAIGTQTITARQLTAQFNIVHSAVGTQSVNTIYSHTIINDGSGTQIVRFTGIPRFIVDTLVYDETYDYERDFLRELNDTLVYTDNYTVNTTFNRPFADTFVFNEQFDTALIIVPGTPTAPVGTPLTSPVIRPLPGVVVGIKNAVVFESILRTVTLPAPVLGDSGASVNEVKFKRTMANTIYLWKKTSPDTRFKWTFRLSIAKALELQLFLTEAQTIKFNVTTWLAEKWRVTLITNPVEIVSTGRSKSEGELVTMEIELQGVRIGA